MWGGRVEERIVYVAYPSAVLGQCLAPYSVDFGHEINLAALIVSFSFRDLCKKPSRSLNGEVVRWCGTERTGLNYRALCRFWKKSLKW